MYRPGRCNTAANALSQCLGADGPEPDSKDAENDGCVAICSSLKTGTALRPDLVTVWVERRSLRQLQAFEASETGNDEAVQDNSPTLPGYSKAELQNFQTSDLVLGVLSVFWNRQRKSTYWERGGQFRHC